MRRISPIIFVQWIEREIAFMPDRASQSPLLEPESTQQEASSQRWTVIIFNNELTSFEDVVEILIRSTDCDAQEAFMETWEANTFGKANVHFAEKERCQFVAEMIESIGVETQVKKEWED